MEPFHAFIVVIASADQKNFYLHSLMWMAQIAEQCDFQQEWLQVDGVEELRSIILNSWKKRVRY
jgi:hypothetical protein